ncbi:MAG: [protein-PII] uridylyltransferase [Deltaproteobacteria bacterium]|nr:[protein-PII] uridylyltransferase [Deltaproteobacteria bacterium]
MLFKRKFAAFKKEAIHLLHEVSEDLSVYRIPFKIGESAVESAREYREHCQETLRKMELEAYSSDFLVRLASLYMDDLILTLFERADWLFQETHPKHPRKCALFALGGYGRSEMNLHSDVDLLFVYPDAPDEYVNYLTDAILYVLWDIKLEVGSATRSLKDCQKIMRGDVVTFTSYLDQRYLAGNQETAQKLILLLGEELASKNNTRIFAEAKRKEMLERHQKYGASVYILEPNLKEGEGGLRDYQTLLWIGLALSSFRHLEDFVMAGILTEGSFNELISARNFLWRLRNAIHFRVQKKSDQLTFPLQEQIAREFGFEESGGVLAVEKFMQCYYHHAANIKRITSLAISLLIQAPEKRLKIIQKKSTEHFDEYFGRLEGRIVPLKQDVFEKNPLNLLNVFLIAQRENLALDEECLRLLTLNVTLVDEEYLKKAEVQERIRELFGHIRGLGRILTLMHDVRLLDRLIPEFGEVLYRVQHDVYHIYTVDTHSIVAVYELTKLLEGAYDEEFPLFKDVLLQTPRPDLLALGTFFHDVGKGRGKNHSIVGAEMAHRAAQRMGYDDKECETVEFLVKSHLLMPHLSQRRDLGDSNLIIQFARSMQHMDNLNMLFLLTWADIRAVGPEVWTPWKGSLLTQLYQRTKQVLESGNFTKERAEKMMLEVRDEVVAALGNHVDSSVKRDFLDQMPIKYFLAHSPAEIASHLKQIEEVGLGHILIQITELKDENMNELLLHASSTPGLLAKTTGVLAVNNLNILEAKQYISKNGWALISLRFTDIQGQMLSEHRRWDLLKKDLLDIFEGRLRISDLIEQRKRPSWLTKKVARNLPTRIEIDNDVSAYYTIIEIYANDRVGILYQILTALSSLGLYVDVSKISTKVDQVADVFYVKDIFGQKIMESEKLKRIKMELLKVIEGD